MTFSNNCQEFDQWPCLESTVQKKKTRRKQKEVPPSRDGRMWPTSNPENVRLTGFDKNFFSKYWKKFVDTCCQTCCCFFSFSFFLSTRCLNKKNKSVWAKIFFLRFRKRQTKELVFFLWRKTCGQWKKRARQWKKKNQN